jgi:hypothetical protein
MALLDNYKKGVRQIASIGDVFDVPVRAGKQLLQTGKYLANEGIGAATGIKFPGITNESEPILGGVKDRIGQVADDVKSDLAGMGAKPVQTIGAIPEVSKMSNGQLPNDFVKQKGGVKSALNSIYGDAAAASPPAAAAPVTNVTQVGAGTPPPAAQTASAQPAKAQPIDGGSGFAVVDGKRINYQDIGATGDPLKKSGGYVMTKAVPGIGDIPSDPNVGAADREYNRQVQQARTTQDQLNLSGIGVMDPGAAVRDIAFRQGQQDLDQRGEAVNIAGQKEASEADYRNRVLAINAPLIGANTQKALSDAAVNQFAISPEGVKQAQAKEGLKDRKDAVTKYFNLFKDRSLPQDWAGKHMEIAKKYAMADDPSNDYSIRFNPASPNKMGIGVSKKLFDPMVQDYLKKGYSEGDAMARAFGDLQGLQKSRGEQLYENIPNMDRFPKTGNKPENELGV